MIVSDIGPRDAKIMLVGEAPGADEERQGKPFVGSSGRMLKQMLRHVGIDYASCYVTNVCNVRPPNNDFTIFYDDKQKKVPTARLEEFWRNLLQKVESIRPNIVIALGNEALRAITNKRGIKSRRGTMLFYKGIKVMPTFHPRYVIAQYQDLPIVEADLAKALKESYSPNWIKPNVQIMTNPSLTEALTFLRTTKGKCAIDIETVERHIRCIAVARKAGDLIQSMSIPLMRFADSYPFAVSDKLVKIPVQSDTDTSYWSIQDEIKILDALGELLKNPDIKKVGQNAISFDAPLLESSLGLYINEISFDTMHAWHVLYPEFPKSLSFQVSMLTDYQNYWIDKNTDIDLSEWEYNAWDAAATLEVSEKIENELHEEGLWDYYFNHRHKLVYALQKAQVVGINVDQETMGKLKEEAEERRSSLKAEIEKIAKHEVNPNSHPQMKKLLYDEMKFPVIYSDAKRPTTDENALRKLEKKYPNEPILRHIIMYRKESKLISTYLEAIIDDDGRIRTSWNASGTEGARISSSKTIWGTGLNFQNIPAARSRGVQNIRNVFIPSKGKSFVKGDLSQAETRVVSEILRRLGDSTLSRLYSNPNFDIHTWMASFIYDRDESTITKAERAVGKLANHSGNYKAGPRVLYNKALKDGIEGVDYSMSKHILDVRLKAIPGLLMWWSHVEAQVRRTRTLKTCLGHRRLFFGRFSDDTFRDAISYEPQSTVGDLLNMIFWKLSESLKEGCDLVAQIHDEVLLECFPEDIEYCKQAIRDAANIPLWVCKDVPLVIPIDISVGENWRDCQ